MAEPRPASPLSDRLPYIIAAVTLIADQVSKALVVGFLGSPHGPDRYPLIPGVLSLHYLTNTGAAFGMLPDRTLLFTLVAIIVAAVIIVYYHHMPTDQVWLKVSFGLQLGGAVGNLVDRLRLGHVVDFIDIHVWPVFNLADSAIVIGVIILAAHLWLGAGQSSRQPEPEKSSRLDG